MLMPDVLALLVDPDLGAHSFTVKRRQGEWVAGRFVVSQTEEQTFSPVGIIQPAGSETLKFFPEGERREGQIVIYTSFTLHLTEKEDVSDSVIWQGEEYKIIHVDRWQEWGFNIAYAAKR